MEDMPKFVLTATICMLLLGIGLFVVLVTVTNIGMESSIERIYTVDDSTVDKSITLPAKPSAEPIVIQFNGIEWVSVDPAYVEWNGEVGLVVEHEGMFG